MNYELSHGVDADGNETTTSIRLVDYTNGHLNALNDWTFFDLSSLGEVEKVYFTLNSTDVGAYGMNTAAYFCMDKFQVETAATTDVAEGYYLVGTFNGWNQTEEGGRIAFDNENRATVAFAIISHPDAGKTTLTEKFLLYGGAINLAGSVKGKATARHAVSDWMEIEKQRG